MADYTPNSHRFKEEHKDVSSDRKIEKVVKGNVTTKKKSEISKFTDAFLAEDFRTAASFVLVDALIPGAKRLCRDIAVEFVETIFGTRGSSKRSDTSPKVSYRKYWDQREDDRNSYDAPRARTRFNYEDIIFDSRGEAEAVLDEMMAVLQRYDFVRVADLYDMCGLDQPYTSNRYGWSNLGAAAVLRVSGGYTLKLPKASPIN